MASSHCSRYALVPACLYVIKGRRDLKTFDVETNHRPAVRAAAPGTEYAAAHSGCAATDRRTNTVAPPIVSVNIGAPPPQITPSPVLAPPLRQLRRLRGVSPREGQVTWSA